VLSAAERWLVAATFALLLLAPASGSAGLRGAMLVIASAALVVARRRHLLDDLLAIPRPVLAAVVAWGALATLSLAWSIDPRFTLSELRGEVAYGLLAFAIFFVAAATPARWRLWWIGVITGSLAVFVLMAAQQSGAPLSRHPIEGGAGPWSTHLVLVAPLLLAVTWPRPWGFDRGVPAKFAALFLLMLAAAMTGNRIIWAAFAAQLAVLIAISGSMPAMEPARIAMLRRLAVIVAVALGVGFAASVLERNQQHYRSDPSLTASIDRDLRPRLWSVAWTEFRNAPWLGHGFGREILREKFLVVTPRVPDHPKMLHSHNMFSDIALQLGLVGVALILAVLATLGREYRGYLRDARLAPLGVIGLALIAGFVVKNLTDDFFYRHNALVFWALNGMLLGLGRATSRHPPPATSRRW
jgi:O-antigen ligase